MTLLKSLLNAGILPGDAQVLDGEFANEPDFLNGLEQVARAIVTGNVALLPPAGEPWCSIHLAMISNGQAPDMAFSAALAAWPPAVQVALGSAVSFRMQEIQHWFQQLQNQGKHRKSTEYIKILAHLGYTFQYNLCTHAVEVNGQPMSDPVQAQIRGKLRDANIFEINIAEDAYLAEAWEKRYHPIKNYLTGLKFQGGDPIGDLAAHFTDTRGVIGIWLRRWLIGACARVMAGEQNRMIVLDGPQGLGKDYVAHWLCSSLAEYFHEGPIMPDEKDHRIRLMSTWIWNVNELGSTTRRSDREALKAFLTLQTVRERKPYGHYDIQGQAISSFWGTVNNESGILSDPTGHRRFMIAALTGIDWNYTQLDVSQIWAQAFDLYLSGETWKLEGQELAQANEINDEYQSVDMVEEVIKKLFVIDPGNINFWMSSLEIMEILKDPLQGDLKTGIEIDPRRMASALTKMGLEKPVQRRLGSKRERGYFGIRRGP